MAVGYPTVKHMLSGIPQEFWGLANVFFRTRPQKQKQAIVSDLEILLDELFRLQVLALNCPSLEQFFNETQQRTLILSDFCFDEALRQDEVAFYPPLYPLFVQGRFGRQLISEHMEDVRWMLGTLTRAVLDTYGEPTAAIVENCSPVIGYLVNSFRSFNPTHSLAIFTTNYDLGFEIWARRQRQVQYYDGFARSSWQPEIGYSLKDNCLSYFYLHGCSRWVIRIPEIPAPRNLQELRKIWHDGWRQEFRPVVERIHNYDWFSFYEDPDQDAYPSVLFPSTVKKRYTHSPPFGFAYEQFAKALESVSILIIVGYAGRDEAIKELLYEAFKNRSTLKAILIDINSLPCHYEDVISSSKLTLVTNPQGLCRESIDEAHCICQRLIGERTES